MADLLIGWSETDKPGEWQATHPGNGQRHMSVLLTVWLDGEGLWRAVAEYKYQDGTWPAPSPFATRELAQRWAESRADNLGMLP